MPFRITGTTAKEAEHTISGSIGMMKASWSNLLTAIADDDADFEGQVNNFVDSLVTVANNLLPRIKTVISGLGQLVGAFITDVLPSVLAEIPSKGVRALRRQGIYRRDCRPAGHVWLQACELFRQKQ